MLQQRASLNQLYHPAAAPSPGCAQASTIVQRTQSTYGWNKYAAANHKQLHHTTTRQQRAAAHGCLLPLLLRKHTPAVL
jgi:hypothetical protein